jgi:hypothetical protein
MEFIQWNYVLPHCKLMPSLWLALVPLLIAGIICWDIPVQKFYPLLLIVITYLCPPLSLHYRVFRVGAISPINCPLVSLPLQVMILLNICMLMFGVRHRFPLLMATAIMYSLSIILPSIVGFILCITSRMCLLYLSNSRPESRIHDRHIGKVPLQGFIPMRTQTYTKTYPNSIRVQRSINNKINFII